MASKAPHRRAVAQVVAQSCCCWAIESAIFRILACNQLRIPNVFDLQHFAAAATKLPEPSEFQPKLAGQIFAAQSYAHYFQAAEQYLGYGKYVHNITCTSKSTRSTIGCALDPVRPDAR